MFRLLILHTNDDIWHRFYDTTINLQVYKSPQFIESFGNYYIKSVLFESFINIGAIRFIFYRRPDLNPIDPDPIVIDDIEEYKSDDKILIYNSFFLNCYCHGSGGSIYANTGSCIQYRICSINSQCTGLGCHSFVDTIYENYIIDSSISKCNGPWCSVDLSRGYQFIGSTNITNSLCEHKTGFGCSYPFSHQINFTSIVQCRSDHYKIVDHTHENHYVSHCNFLNNTSHFSNETNSKGLVTFSCKLEYSLCAFISNTSPFLFFNEYYGELFVSQCFIQDNKIYSTASGENIIINTTDSLVINVHKLPIHKCKLFEAPKSLSYNPYQDPDKLKMKPI